jgi:site-specific recombinase XerD
MVLDYLLLDSAALPRHLASLNYFLLSKKVEGRSPATLEWLSRSLNDLYHFLESRGLTLLPEEIQPVHIRAWLAHLQDRGLSKNSINDKYRSVSSFVSWCLAEGIIKTSPLKNIKTPTPGKPLIPIFRQEHIKALLRLCPPNTLWGARDRGIIFTFLHTGIRRGELVGLRKTDVDLNRDVITVTGKGDKTRQVYLALEAQRAILGYLRLREDSSGTLFVTLDGRPITGNAIQCMLSDLGRRAGIDDVRVSAHTFRHTFAVNFLRAGGSLRHLQEVMGHASMEPLEHYLRIVNADDAIQVHRQIKPFKGWQL